MSRAPDYATFVAGLRREAAAFDEFVAILRLEQDALVKAEVEPLSEFARKKESMVEELNALTRMRNAYLGAHAVPPSAQGMRDLIGGSTGAQAEELIKLWDSVAQGAAEAQRLNRSNGKLINNRLAFNRDALKSLTGLTRPSGVYNRDGSTGVGVTHRHFGAA